MTALLASAASAQSTWIVDASNGPGTHFLDLPPALAKAVDNDIILVRPGVYTADATSKGLKVIGVPAADGQMPKLQGRFLVDRLAAEKTFVLSGFASVDREFSLMVLKASGRVHLQALTFVGPEKDLAAVQLDDCWHVTIADCNFFGVPAVANLSSTSSISDSVLQGAHFTEELLPPGPGLLADGDSFVYLASVEVRGGDGCQRGRCPPEPAVHLIDGELMVLGDEATMLCAGSDMPESPCPAIRTEGGFVHHDPHVQLVPWGGADPIEGSAVVIDEHYPATDASVSGAGVITATVISEPNDLVFLLGGRPGDQIYLTPFGQFWLDPMRVFYIGVGVQGPTGHWQMDLPGFHNGPMGMPFGLQAVAGIGFDLRLSNTVVLISR